MNLNISCLVLIFKVEGIEGARKYLSAVRVSCAGKAGEAVSGCIKSSTGSAGVEVRFGD